MTTPTPKDRILMYAEDCVTGRSESNRWIYAACKRFSADLLRQDIYFDWDEADRLNAHYESLKLVGEWTDQPFVLHDWQLFVVSNIICWKHTEDNRRRFKLNLIQVARGNGKTTLLAGLALYDLLTGKGRRVNCIANNYDQATLVMNTASTMLKGMDIFDDDIHNIRHDGIFMDDTDSEVTALPAMERSLDGLNPSMWIADEAAEFKGRFLTKLLTTGAKRKQSTGVIITTPGSNPENIYMEIVKQCESILSGEIIDDSVFAALYGLDIKDELEDESKWIKGNPGLPYGQPDLVSIRRAWTTMKQSPMGRAEFSRFHGSRFDENSGGWLDMSLWDTFTDKGFDWDSTHKQPAWIGLDLSRTHDMTALVVAIPTKDGRVALKGHYWFPSEGLAQRELDFRMPVRTWAKEGRLQLCPGREIDYEQIRIALKDLSTQYDIRAVGYDAWGSKYLAEVLVSDGLPLVTYRMAISTFGPGCALFNNLWLGRKFIIGDDPILRRACAEANAKADVNGNVRPVKSRDHTSIDALVASIIAIHSWGGTQTSVYEREADQLINGESPNV